MNNSILFRRSSENLQHLHRSILNQIDILPKGTLKVYYRTKNGKQYSDFIFLNPQGKKQYVKSQPAFVKKMVLKMFLQKELQRIEEFISAADAAAESADNLSISSILKEIPQELREYLSFDEGNDSIKTRENVSKARLEKWKKEPYSGNTHYESKRKHRTSDGTLVKSKAELIIYEKLLQYGITFKYEYPIKIGNITYYPDFTIMLPDGTIIYWEHAGMMNDPKYTERHKTKLAAYESVGIVPWKNLIVTYDDEDGNLDIRIVESEIKNKLLNR